MKGFFVVNPEVLVARELERGGRSAPALEFIRWRMEQLREEVQDDAEFWGIPRRDIAASRAEQLAEARGGNEGINGNDTHVADTAHVSNYGSPRAQDCERT